MLVVYMHGIKNKPPAPVLKVQWDVALFGRDMGDRSRMAYWADILYGSPLGLAQPGPTPANIPEGFQPLSDEDLVQQTKDLVPEDAEGFADALSRRLLDAAHDTETMLGATETGTVAATSVEAKFLPAPIRGALTGPVLKSLVPDTAAYFFRGKKDAMRDRLRTILGPAREPCVVIAHSMGTVISYEVLCEMENQGIDIPLYITLGSPLGIQEIEDLLDPKPRMPACVKRWVNIADPFDFVALDKNLSGEFDKGSGAKIEDHLVVNPNTRHLDPHSGTGYLSTSACRDAVRAVAGMAFSSPISDFVVAKDLAADLAGSLARRISVLIELGEPTPDASLDQKRAAVVKSLADLDAESKASGLPRPPGEEDGQDYQCVDPLRYYVAARLTPPELEKLAAQHADLKFSRVWRNTPKAALVYRSTQTLQVETARLGYGADGAGISWAVLDTGVQPDHPHFQTYDNIAAIWDCTQQGPPQAGHGPKPVMDKQGQPVGRDRNGHGTHVAGIVAGTYTVTAKQPVKDKNKDVETGTMLNGMAPKAKLHIYKTLTDAGAGDDSFVIKALDHIASLNDSAPSLVIHGVNLSLGGGFDPTVYQCGFSPICREVRRLWRQGVIVCIAAGNEGRLALLTAEGGTQALNVDLSIGDPANLEEAIAVGSVHRDAPHLYGISYFSSRGPTADGRQKPDTVAPGESILSCNSRFADPGQPLYLNMSGTSMACPHVSGLLAAFLSVRAEHIGYPERAKGILLTNCTDLGRNAYHQGAGLPNLVRMLLNA